MKEPKEIEMESNEWEKDIWSRKKSSWKCDLDDVKDQIWLDAFFEWFKTFTIGTTKEWKKERRNEICSIWSVWELNLFILLLVHTIFLCHTQN